MGIYGGMGVVDKSVVSVAVRGQLGKKHEPQPPQARPWKRRNMLTRTNSERFVDLYLKGAMLYTIRMPKDLAWDPKRAMILIQHLLTQFGSLSFLITAQGDQISWQVLDLWQHAPSGVLSQAIHSIYPEVLLDTVPYSPLEFKKPFYRSLIQYRQANDFVAPMQTIEDLKGFDPLASLLRSMRPLRKGERIVHMIHIIEPISPTLREAAQKRITVSQIHPLQFLSAHGIGQALGIMLSGNPRVPRFREHDQKILEERLQHGLLYNAFVMTQVDVEREADLTRLSNLVSSLLQFGSDYNLLMPSGSFEKSVHRVESPLTERATSALGLLGAWFEGSDPSFTEVRAVLSVEEIAALWHLPYAGFSIPEIQYLPIGEHPLPAALAHNQTGICLGVNTFGGRQTAVRMLDADRATHINVIGKTGVGKSTLMHTMIYQDIQNGNGVGVVDPHGKLIIDILRNSIPDRRIDDVVVLDIANLDYPPPMNPLIIPGEQNQVSVGQVVSVFDKIYDVKAQRMEDSLTAALSTLAVEHQPTVRDVVRLFTDPAYRSRLLHQVSDPVTFEFWNEFERQSPSMQRDLAYPVIYRMRHFYRNPTLAPILCHPDALNFSALIAQKKIILLSLGIDERKVPAPERQLLGALLVSQLQMAVMANLSPITPFSLYIDEAQNFVTSSLEVVLAEARKYGLHLTLANQFMGQLRGSLLESVLGTVGATVVFQCGLNDAKLLAPYFAPNFKSEDLMNLPLYHAAIKMRHAGQTLPAFSLQTLPPPTLGTEQGKKREAIIRARSVSRYTPKSRQQVLAWLVERYPSDHSKPDDYDDEDDEGFTDWSVPER